MPPSPLKPIIPKTTKALGAASLSHISNAAALASVDAVGGTSALTFLHPGKALRAIRLGNILVSGTTRDTPDGLLRRVTAVHRSKNRVVFQTVPVALEDAIQQGTVDASGTIGTGGYYARTIWRHGRPTTLMRPRQAINFCFDHAFSLPGGTADHAHVCFTVSWHLTYSIKLFQPSQFPLYDHASRVRSSRRNHLRRTKSVEADETCLHGNPNRHPARAGAWHWSITRVA